MIKRRQTRLGLLFFGIIGRDFLERGFIMFEKVNRSGLIIYLYYNRDAKKLQDYGDITYHSKKHRYLQLYVPTQEVEQLVGRLSKEKFIKKSQSLSYPRAGNTLCGQSLSRGKRYLGKSLRKVLTIFLIIRYILNMLFI